MKEIIVISIIAMLVSCGSGMADAPNSGDGVSDGSGWEEIPPQDGEGDPDSDPDPDPDPDPDSDSDPDPDPDPVA